eukprot:9764687-Prorocentrum_lima.AAC.1
MKMSSYDREQWVDARRAELPSFDDLEVFDQVMPEDITAVNKNWHSSKEIACKIDPGEEA